MKYKIIAIVIFVTIAVIGFFYAQGNHRGASLEEDSASSTQETEQGVPAVELTGEPSAPSAAFPETNPSPAPITPSSKLAIKPEELSPAAVPSHGYIPPTYSFDGYAKDQISSNTLSESDRLFHVVVRINVRGSLPQVIEMRANNCVFTLGPRPGYVFSVNYDSIHGWYDCVAANQGIE